MKATLGVVALAVLGAAGCSSQQADAPVPASRHTATVKTAVTQDSLRIMPLGASITWGTASRDGNGYRKTLRARLEAAGIAVNFVGSRRSGTMADAENEGHPGYRIDQLAAGANRWLAASRPDVILLNAGGNDTIQNHDLATSAQRLHALINQLHTDRPSATIFVSNLVPAGTAARDTRVRAFNAQLPAIVQAEQKAGRKVYLVDLNSAVTAKDIGRDHIHPTEPGYQKLANRWADTIIPLLKKRA